MVLSILLGIVALFLIGFIIILISPFSFYSTVTMFRRWNRPGKNVLVAPVGIVRLYEFKKKVLDIRLFNRFVVYSRSLTKNRTARPRRKENAQPSLRLHDSFP